MTSSSRANAASIELQLHTVKTGRRGATASPAVEQPADPSLLSAEVPKSPKGVGVSLGTRGEDVGRKARERGRKKAQRDATPAGRPAGHSSQRDSTSAAAQEPRHGGPNLQTGDQGG